MSIVILYIAHRLGQVWESILQCMKSWPISYIHLDYRDCYVEPTEPPLLHYRRGSTFPLSLCVSVTNTICEKVMFLLFQPHKNTLDYQISVEVR